MLRFKNPAKLYLCFMDGGLIHLSCINNLDKSQDVSKLLGLAFHHTAVDFQTYSRISILL